MAAMLVLLVLDRRMSRSLMFCWEDREKRRESALRLLLKKLPELKDRCKFVDSPENWAACLRFRVLDKG